MLWLQRAGVAVLVAFAQPVVPDSARLAQTRENLATWLTGSALADKLESVKLRWVPRPDSLNDEGPHSLLWELRFRTRDPQVGDENARFLQLVRDYRGAVNRTLSETLFFKLKSESGQRRADVAISILVLDHTFSISFDPAKRELAFQRDPDRMIRAYVDLSGVGTRETSSTGTAVLSLTSPRIVQQIQSFLESYFAGPWPVRVSPDLPEPDYAGITVEGIRGRVLRNQNYWAVSYTHLGEELCAVDGRASSPGCSEIGSDDCNREMPMPALIAMIISVVRMIETALASCSQSRGVLLRQLRPVQPH